MNDASAVIVALVLWRLVVAVLAAVAIAIALMLAAPVSNPPVAVAIVILGAAAGIVWQSKAELPAQAVVQPPVSRPVAFLALALAGIFWGGILEFATGHSSVAAALLAATPTLSSPVVVAITKKALSLRQLGFATIAFIAGFGMIFAIHSIASSTGV